MVLIKEEEIKLKDYNDDILKLGFVEKFFKGIFDILFVFKRVEVMLYKVNFDIEVKYFRKLFEILEVKKEMNYIVIFRYNMLFFLVFFGKILELKWDLII